MTDPGSDETVVSHWSQWPWLLQDCLYLLKHGRISILQMLASNPSPITCLIVFPFLNKLSEVQFVPTLKYLLQGAQNATLAFSHCNSSTFTARANVLVTLIVVASKQKAYRHKVSRSVNVSWVPLSHRPHTSPTGICTREQQIWSNLFAQSGGWVHYHLL